MSQDVVNGFNMGYKIADAWAGQEQRMADRKLARDQAAQQMAFTDQTMKIRDFQYQVAQNDFQQVLENQERQKKLRMVDNITNAVQGLNASLNSGDIYSVSQYKANLQQYMQDQEVKQAFPFLELDRWQMDIDLQNYNPEELDRKAAEFAGFKKLEYEHNTGQPMMDEMLMQQWYEQGKMGMVALRDTQTGETNFVPLQIFNNILFSRAGLATEYAEREAAKAKAALEARKTVSDINNTDQDTINKHDENNRENVSLPGNMAKTQSETNKNNADATATLNKTNIENNEAKMRAFAHQQSFNQHGDNPTAKVDNVDGVPVWNPQTGKNGGPNEEMLKQDIQTNLNRIGLNLSNMVDTNGNIPYTPQQSLALSRDLSNVLAQINMLPEEYRKSLDNQSNADVIASVASRVNPTDKEHIRTQYNQVMGHKSPDNFGMTISEIENVNNEVAKFNSENTGAGNIRASGVMEIWQDIGQFFGANGTTINNEKLRDLLRRMPATLVRNTSDGRDSNMSQKAFGIDNGVFAKTSDTQKVHNLVQNTKTLIKNASMSSTSPLDKAVLEQLAQNSEKNLVVLEIAVNADKKYLTRNIKEIKSTNIDDIKRAAESSSVYKVMSDGSVYFYPQQTRISERGLPLGIKFNSLDEFNKQKAKWQ